MTEGSSHIPYSESKLTKILRDTLGGNSRTTLIVTCSPAIVNLAETCSTLKFGVRAKKIKNKPILNEELSKERLIKDLEKYKKKIKKLEGHVSFLKSHIKNKLGAKVPAYKGKGKEKQEKKEENEKS